MIPYNQFSNPLFQPQPYYIPQPNTLQELQMQNALLQLHLNQVMASLYETSQMSNDTTYQTTPEQIQQMCLNKVPSQPKKLEKIPSDPPVELWQPLVNLDSNSSGSSNEEDLDNQYISTDFSEQPKSIRPEPILKKKIQKRAQKLLKSVVATQVQNQGPKYLEDKELDQDQSCNIQPIQFDNEVFLNQDSKEEKLEEQKSPKCAKNQKKSGGSLQKTQKKQQKQKKDRVKLSQILDETHRKQQLNSNNLQNSLKNNRRKNSPKNTKKNKKKSQRWSLKKYMNPELEKMLCGQGVSIEYFDEEENMQKKQFFTFSWDFCWMTTFDETNYRETFQKLRVENLNYSVNECLDELVIEYEDSEKTFKIIMKNIEDVILISKFIRGFQMINQRFYLNMVGKQYREELNKQCYLSL